MTISIIVAMDQNGVIGKSGNLPWHFPEDLEYFQEKTMGKYVIMGQNTYKSIKSKLEGRKLIVLSRDNNWQPKVGQVAHSISEALSIPKENEEVFIGGGESVYRQFLPKADKLYITQINEEFDGDTYFPDFKRSAWNLIYEEKGDNPLLTFKILKR